MKKRTLGMLLAVLMVISLLPTAAFAADGELPGARVETNNSGDVFLGGNYIEVGISKHGSFGTSCAPTTAGWHKPSNVNGIGLLSDEDGWNVGVPSRTGDFFLPGTAEERWILSYRIGGEKYEHHIADRNNGAMGEWTTEPIAENASSDVSNGRLRAIVNGVTEQSIGIQITYSFGVNDLFYITDVTITNHGDQEIQDVRFVRSFDPDQDQYQYGTYNTYNKVICNPDSTKPGDDTNYAMVVARGANTLSGFFFLSFDNRARASRQSKLSPGSAYDAFLWDHAPVTDKTFAMDDSIRMSDDETNGYILEDGAIALTFNIGNLSPNESTDLSYYSSLDPDVQDSLKNVLSGNVNYQEETLIDLETGKTYHITCNGTTYIFSHISGNSIPLSGNAKTMPDGVPSSYDFIGKTITIVEVNEDGESVSEEQEIDIAPRPGQSNSGESKPHYPAPVLTGITADANSLTIPAVDTQEYSLNGSAWEKPTGETVVFSGLQPGTQYTIYTRVAATNKHPVSETISAAARTHCLITVKPSPNGQTAVDKESAAEGEIVIITVTPDQDYYRVEGLPTVLGNDSEEVTLADNGDSTYSFIMPAHGVTVSVVFSKVQYTVTFVNEDGTVLQTGEVAYGELPTYTGETPAKAATAQYAYTFKGWTPAVESVTGKATYTATFDSAVNKYTITFQNEDGTMLQTGEVAYGETPTYTGETPAKEATAQYAYTFKEWTPAVESVTDDATYTATFSNVINIYTIEFVANDGIGTMTSVMRKWGEVFKLPVCQFTARQGYAFKCWLVKGDFDIVNHDRQELGLIAHAIAEDTEQMLNPDTGIIVRGPITIKAQWQELPQTGDESHMALWLCLMGLASAGMILLRRRAYN